MNKLRIPLSLIAALALPSPSFADWNGGGGGGSASGVIDIATACPTAAAVSGHVTLTGAVPVVAKTGTYVVLTTDCGKFIEVTSGTFTITLPAPGTAGAGWYLNSILNLGAGVVTVATASGNLNNASTVTLNQNQGINGVAVDATAANYVYVPATASVATLSGLGSGWATPLGAALGANWGTAFGSGLGTNWTTILAAAAGTNWSTALAANLNSGWTTLLAAAPSGTGGVGVSTTSAAKTANNLAVWNAAGDVVDGGAPTSPAAWSAAVADSAVFFALDPVGETIGTLPVATLNFTYCNVFTPPKTVTISGIVIDLQTVGVTASPGAHAWIVNNSFDATSHHNFPLSTSIVATDNNGPATTASPMTFTFGSNVQLVKGTTYWKCFQFADTTVKPYGQLNNTTISADAAQRGSSAAAFVQSDIGLKTSSAGTFGTFPTSTSYTSGLGWTASSSVTVPAAGAFFVSIP